MYFGLPLDEVIIELFVRSHVICFFMSMYPEIVARVLPSFVNLTNPSIAEI